MVDATVVSYRPDAYDRVLAGLDPARRRAAEGTLGGLRFVRNWMGYHADPADFVRPGEAPGGGDCRSRSGPGCLCRPRRPALPRMPGRGR
ncbi:MAG: hypothetical protein ACRDNO_12345 [Trebonia sp.]